MAGGGLQMADRNMSFITYLPVHVRWLCHFLLTVEELHNCACKVLIGCSEIHHGNNARELGVRAAHALQL